MNSFCVFLSLLDIRISVILRFLAHILRFLAQNFAFCVILRHFAYFASFSPTENIYPLIALKRQKHLKFRPLGQKTEISVLC